MDMPTGYLRQGVVIISWSVFAFHVFWQWAHGVAYVRRCGSIKHEKKPESSMSPAIMVIIVRNGVALLRLLILAPRANINMSTSSLAYSQYGVNLY